MASRYNSHKDDDDDYDYSDSFVSDDDDESVTKKPTRKVAQVTGRRKPPRQPGYKGRMSSRATTQSHEPKLDNAVQRMLSSKNLRINELKNQLEDFKNTLSEMKEENKLLKKTGKRQEKALNKFENEESDLPQLLQRHNNEVRTLREQLRKTQDKYSKTDRYLRDAEDELDKTKNKLKKFKHLVEDKELQERQELAKKLQQAEIDLEERDVKVRDLEKHINHLNKNHRHELGIEIARHRDLQKQIESLRNDNDELENKFREKVKAVELANIYSLRRGKKLPASYSGTPNRTPPPRRKRVPSLHELTPREKGKLFEDKRKEEQRLHRERGDGPKMAFNAGGSSNRSKNKETSKKQENVTYRAPGNESKNYGYESKNYSNENKSHDSYDDDRTGYHEKSGHGFEPHGYDYSSTQEKTRNSSDGVFSKPMLFTGSKQKSQNPYQLSYEKKKDTFSDSNSVFSKPPLFKKGNNHRGFSDKKKHRTRHREQISANPTFLTQSNDSELYPTNLNSDRRPKQQERQKREKEELQRQKAEEEERRRQHERDEQEMRELEQLELERRQRDNRDREEQRKRDQEAEEYLRKMEKDKRSREKEEDRVREEQQRKEREERERRDRERHEQEKRAKEERDRMEMDAQLAEERMKKDELLKKLRMIDEGQNKKEEKKMGNDLYFPTSNKPKKPEEKKTTGNDLFFTTQRRDSDAGSATSSKKSYSFTKPIENMHNGKPAREDVSVPYIDKQRKQRDTSPVGSYQPSFGLSTGITGGGKKTKKSTGQVIFDDYENKSKTNKKSDLMADLFGSQTSKPNKSTDLDKSDDIFNPPVRTTKTTATKTSGFPWDEDNKKTTTTNSHKERSSSLFGGGGSGILDDNESSVFDSTKMLPKRGRQPNTTFQSKPVVSAVDHFDDDIEEIIM